mmetsp:Transcript_107643/g.299879  ORF Transcript_107643/g.299879 Transcript_107643/m.299879 type:complete len:91 (+) Transcript_107643:160-432(+)
MAWTQFKCTAWSVRPRVAQTCAHGTLYTTVGMLGCIPLALTSAVQRWWCAHKRDEGRLCLPREQQAPGNFGRSGFPRDQYATLHRMALYQ